MKTRELIRLLQEADPSGEEQVVVGNEPILDVDRLPAYYDGLMQVLIEDESKKPYYAVIGAAFVNTGTKITIMTHSIEWAVLENPDLPVTIPAGSIPDYQKRLDKWRADGRRVEDHAQLIQQRKLEEEKE